MSKTWDDGVPDPVGDIIAASEQMKRLAEDQRGRVIVHDAPFFGPRRRVVGSLGTFEIDPGRLTIERNGTFWVTGSQFVRVTDGEAP